MAMQGSTAEAETADEGGGRPRSVALVAAASATLLLLLLHLLQSAAVMLVLYRAKSEGLGHAALALAGAVSGVVFYAWAARGLLARRAAAARWALRVDLVLAALGVVTLADEWQRFDRPWVDLGRFEPLAVTSLGFPAVMTAVYLAAAALTFAARRDVEE
jgi:hypothetical protein